MNQRSRSQLWLNRALILMMLFLILAGLLLQHWDAVLRYARLL